MKRIAQRTVGTALVIMALGSTSSLAGQVSNGPPVQIDADAPEMALLVPARAENAIRDDRDGARRIADSAETAGREVARALEIVRGRIEVRKRESETLKARIDLAKRENRDTERAQLENERDAVDQHVRLLERLRDVYDVERRYLEARRDYGRAGRTLYEQELALSNARANITGHMEMLSNSDFMNLQRQVLQAQRTWANRQRTMFERQEDVFERRTRLLQAQVEWLARQT